MPALRGSLTYARFFLSKEEAAKVPDDFREKFMRAIRLRAMRPLEPDEEDLERSGWCKLGEPFELELRYDDTFTADAIVLGFRTDRWRLPSSTLKARLREAEAAYLEKKGRERLGRRERAELKEMVAKKLRRQSAPATRVVDLVWSLNDGLVRFFSHSPKTGAAMMELFHRTFGLTLVPEAPYTLADRLGLSKAAVAAWQEIDITVLATETT